MHTVSHAILEPRSRHRLDGIAFAAASSSVLWVLIVAAVCVVVRLIA